MRPRLALLVCTFLALTALSLPATAVTPSGFDCAPGDGRERLTTEGLTRDFPAPVTTATGHDLAATGGAPYPAAAIEQSTAHFLFRAYFAPYRWGDLDITLDWVNQGDFDLYVLDADGNELDSSVQFNPQAGIGEDVTVTGIEHCADIQVLVNNYAGRRDEVLTLDIDFENPGPQFACEEEDPHPACEGKLAGEAPATVPETRTRLYLGGDRPGQAAMAGFYVNTTGGGAAGDLPGATLATARPNSGENNSFTHTALGFTNQDRNPLQAHFTAPLAQPTAVGGDVNATVWVSSETLKGVHDNPPGKLYVQLWGDGTMLGQVAAPGTQIASAPTRLSVTLEDLPPVTIESVLTLQLASDPVATSGGAVGNPSDAQWTVYYDSVQFPSFIALNLPAGSLA